MAVINRRAGASTGPMRSTWPRSQLALACAVAGCHTPRLETDASGADTGGSTSVAPTSADVGSSGESGAEPTGDTSSEPTTDGAPSCGDSDVGDDEVCDDGINDGRYGGCLADCSALAEHCGDGEINGSEVCDDGINDAAYEGCGPGCTARGPYCGDGSVHVPQEMCDEGPHNADASGCNVDCTVSGTRLHQYDSPEMGVLSGYVGPVVFRDNDNVLLTAYAVSEPPSQYEQVFIELTPSLAEVSFTPVKLPEIAYKAAMRGSDWLLGAETCDYVVTEDGAITEVCEASRTTVLTSMDDDSYVAMMGSTAAKYGAGSPSLGDAPLWVGTALSDDAQFGYDVWDAAATPLGGVVVVGSVITHASGDYAAYLRGFDADGIPVADRVYSELRRVEQVGLDPAGNVIISGNEPGDLDLVKLDPSLDMVWSSKVCEEVLWNFVVDHVGNIVVECSDATDRYFRKLAPSGEELWSVELDFQFGPVRGDLAVDSNDAILRAQFDSVAGAMHVHVDKFAP
jgi:hypothetical protein